MVEVTDVTNEMAVIVMFVMACHFDSFMNVTPADALEHMLGDGSDSCDVFDGCNRFINVVALQALPASLF